MAGEAKFNILQLLVQHVRDEWVMWPLVLLSVIMITIVIERLIVIWLDRAKLNPSNFADKFIETLEKNKGDRVRTVQEMHSALGKKNNIAAELYRTLFKKYFEALQKQFTPIQTKQWMTEAMEEQASIELTTLDAHLNWLAIISNVATLMGLFGTVYGMIQAFYSMAQSVGGVKADEMAGGIAVALIATLFGLFVAIPSLILYNLIKNSTEAHVVRIEEGMRVVTDKLVE